MDIYAPYLRRYNDIILADLFFSFAKIDDKRLLKIPIQNLMSGNNRNIAENIPLHCYFVAANVQL